MLSNEECKSRLESYIAECEEPARQSDELNTLVNKLKNIKDEEIFERDGEVVVSIPNFVTFKVPATK